MNLKRLMRSRIVSALTEDLEDCLVGRFDEARRADTHHQCRRAAYTAAFGVFGPIKESPIRGNERIWDMVGRMFDRLYEWQGEDGWWRWYKPSTGKVHGNRYVWSVYAWLRLLQDFGDKFDTERRERVEAMLRNIAGYRLEGARQYLETGSHPGSKNIFLSCSLELWLSGRLFDEPEWAATAEKAIETGIDTQFEDGYWPDANVHRGPTTRYNAVTLRALGAYARQSGSENAREKIARAAEYHRRLSYPDGSAVETVDERNRYRPGRLESLVYCFAPFAETRRMAALFAETDPAEAPGKPSVPPGAIEIDAWAATPDEEVEPKPLENESVTLRTIPAAAVRKAPWYACLSGATTQVPSHQFHHDLQNHISLWRDGIGLVAGGGNSLLDPKFSTFRFQGSYLADEGSVEAKDSGAVLRLRYGDIEAEVELTLAERTARFVAEARGPLPPDSEFALHLTGLHGEEFLNDTYASLDLQFPLTDFAFWRTLPQNDNRFRAGRLVVEADRPLSAMWPCKPVEIYDPPAMQPVESAVLRVAVDLTGGPAALTVSASEAHG